MTDPITMPSTVTQRAPIGSLLKKPLAKRRAANERGQVTDAAHLAAIRQLPCIHCGLDPCGEAAHVRSSSGLHNKRNTAARKPDDRWTVPVCRAGHQNDPDSIHKIGELSFFHNLCINPFLLCIELYRHSPDIPKMRAVVFSFMAERESAEETRAIMPSATAERWSK
jgi:hypothetical protein